MSSRVVAELRLYSRDRIRFPSLFSHQYDLFSQIIHLFDWEQVVTVSIYYIHCFSVSRKSITLNTFNV